jgi:hypothetical protein
MPGRSQLPLAVKAVTAALADAGIQPTEAGGLTRYNQVNDVYNVLVTAGSGVPTSGPVPTEAP